jgi:hypothetical protein
MDDATSGAGTKQQSAVAKVTSSITTKVKKCSNRYQPAEIGHTLIPNIVNLLVLLPHRSRGKNPTPRSRGFDICRSSWCLTGNMKILGSSERSEGKHRIQFDGKY